MSRPVMRKPDRTKNTSTPTNPPTTPGIPAWNSRTRRIARPRRPSRSGRKPSPRVDSDGAGPVMVLRLVCRAPRSGLVAEDDVHKPAAAREDDAVGYAARQELLDPVARQDELLELDVADAGRHGHL